MSTASANAPQTDQTVLIGADGRISAVRPSAGVEIPAAVQRIDCTGRFVLPGMINAHADLFADGRPLGAIYLHPRMKGITSRVLHSKLGSKILARRSRTNAGVQMRSGVTTLRTVGDGRLEVID